MTSICRKRNNETEIFKELINNQLKNIPPDKKLQYTDIKRICKYIDSSIFDEDKCSIWTGYITNANNSSKGTYINFYFRKKKSALHRLLYTNFVESLEDDEYLKFNCENKGKCCNVKHLKKFKYQKREDGDSEKPIKDKPKKSNKKLLGISNRVDFNDKDRLRIDFDF